MEAGNILGGIMISNKRFIRGRYYKKVIGGSAGYFIGRAVGKENLKIIVDTDTTDGRYKIGEVYDMEGFFGKMIEISKEEMKVEII
jgi:hypothetical protein